jgi:Tfp pilus assembly protein PilN
LGTESQPKAHSFRLRQAFAFGTGAGIQMARQNLEVAVARVRPLGIQVIGRTTILRFRERPAADWGSEYSAFLGKLGMPHLSATVVLPPDEVIVRQIPLRGVDAKDLEAAIAFQLDSVNPYGNEEVLTGWTALRDGAVLVGVARREIIDRYLEWFTAAGIKTGSFTCAPSAIHAAVRLLAPPPPAFLALSSRTDDAVVIYGESEARPIFSAEFDVARERAIALAVAELRLPPETAPVNLESLLPAPHVNPVENDLAHSPLPYAAALSSACPRFAPTANMLPRERRETASRGIFVPTAVLAAVLLITLLAYWLRPGFQERQYLRQLDSQIGGLELQARRVAALDRQIDSMRARTRLLDDFRSGTRADLDTLNELSRLLPPAVWTNMVEISREAVSISGEADQAAPLIKVLDASPYFHNSEFNGISKVQNAEVFRLRTQRRHP